MSCFRDFIKPPPHKTHAPAPLDMPLLAVAYAVVLTLVLVWSHHSSGRLQRRLDAKERELLRQDHDVADLVAIVFRLHRKVVALETRLAARACSR